MNLKRSDKQYIEVEEFADYELTQCIAYEMAARDWHYKDLADGVVNFYNHYKESIDYYIKKDAGLELVPTDNGKEVKYKGYNSDNIDEKLSLEGLKNIQELSSLISEIDLLNIEDTPIGYQDPRLGEEFWKVKNILDRYYGFNTVYAYKELTFEKDGMLDEIRVTKNIIRDGFIIRTSLSTDDDEYIERDEEYISIDNIDEYIQYMKEESNFGFSKSRSNISIFENFKRPCIDVHSLKTLNPEITINLSRPLNEIISLITHIKSDIEKNNLLKVPIELLGIELVRADNLVCNNKGKCFDPRKVLSAQQKMADMFYIHDCLKLGYSQRKIQNEVYNYYADKGMENITLDPATLRKYRDIATSYIVEGKYKEMLTGISINEFEYAFG